MKTKIPNIGIVRPEKKLSTFSIVSFGRDENDYKDYLIVQDQYNNAIVIDLDDGEAYHDTVDNMFYSEIEDFLKDEVDRDWRILRVIDGDAVEVSSK